MMNLKSFISLICTAALTFSAAAQSLTWGYYNGSQKLDSWGTGKAESYSATMDVVNPSFVGCKVTAIRLPLNSITLTDCAVFISHELPTVKSGVATGDVLNVAFTPATDTPWNEITLDEPWTIDSPTFYVGYTVKATAEEAKPLVFMEGRSEGNLYVATSRTYRKWIEIGGNLGASLPVQLVIETELQEQAVGIYSLNDVNVKHGLSTTVHATVSNHGKASVENIDWTYELNGQTTQGHADVHISSQYYGTLAEIEFTTPAIDENGTYAGTFTITHVNGVDNLDSAPSGTNTVRVLNIVPVKRPLLEEFTGTWCGWCPRGWLGLKLMNEWYPDDFIGASYHNGDAMQITTNYPVKFDGYPAANIDRHHGTDAYYGDGRVGPAIRKTWLKACEETVPANIDIIAELSEDESTINAQADVTFCFDAADTHYGIAYIVTADGLTGKTQDWIQHSYFKGQTSYLDGYLDQFVNGEEYMLLVYDDVVIAQSHSGGACFTGIIPADVKEEQVVSHTIDFELSTMYSNYGNKEYLVQDINKLNVIAMLIDTKTDAVVNCNKVHVKVNTAGSISGVSAADATPVATYSLDGRRIEGQAPGFNIIRMSDGSTVKAMIR